MYKATQMIAIIVIILVIIILVVFYFMRGGYIPFYNQISPSPTSTVSPTPTPSELLSPTPSASPSATTSPSISPTTSPGASPSASASIKTFSISANEYKYVPNVITVPPAELIRITLTNNGTMPHNLIFKGLSVSTPNLNPGQSITIELITPSQSGNYDFYCSINNHENLGLKGTMIVQPPS